MIWRDRPSRRDKRMLSVPLRAGSPLFKPLFFISPRKSYLQRRNFLRSISRPVGERGKIGPGTLSDTYARRFLIYQLSFIVLYKFKTFYARFTLKTLKKFDGDTSNVKSRIVQGIVLRYIAYNII